ncbi:MAG: nuclear transport factor 2 family protein [Burkholderiaceae bacterium]
MDFEQGMRCEQECARLSHDFAWAVDRGLHDAFIALFIPEGALERAGEVLRGPTALRRFLEAMPVNRTMRHLCSNIRIDMTDERHAKGTSAVMMVHALAATGTSLPLPAAVPLVAEYEDDYLLTDNGWKFQYRKTIIVFKP